MFEFLNFASDVKTVYLAFISLNYHNNCTHTYVQKKTHHTVYKKTHHTVYNHTIEILIFNTRYCISKLS